jgi:hypothetical protein
VLFLLCERAVSKMARLDWWLIGLVTGKWTFVEGNQPSVAGKTQRVAGKIQEWRKSLNNTR